MARQWSGYFTLMRLCTRQQLRVAAQDTAPTAEGRNIHRVWCETHINLHKSSRFMTFDAAATIGSCWCQMTSSLRASIACCDTHNFRSEHRPTEIYSIPQHILFLVMCTITRSANEELFRRNERKRSRCELSSETHVRQGRDAYLQEGREQKRESEP